MKDKVTSRIKEYVVTKEECQSSIDKYNYVCERCGQKLVPIKTVDNSGNPTYWSGCMHGTEVGNFTQGVPRDVYKLAYKLVLDDGLYFTTGKYKYDVVSNDFDYWFGNSMEKVCNIITSIEYMKTHKPRYTKTELHKNYKSYHPNLLQKKVNE